jgi:CRP-like cAMP-binding protein
MTGIRHKDSVYAVSSMMKKAQRDLGKAAKVEPGQNHILAHLPQGEYERLEPELTVVSLKAEQVLHDVRDTIVDEYFVTSGLVSTLTVMRNGDSVEVGVVGSEGFTGLPLFLNIERSSYRQNVQIAGTALRVSVRALQRLLPRLPILERRIAQFGYLQALQMSQIAACNRLHEIDERLARWLLMTSDRVRTDTLFLTHEFLGNMLGTRRSSVTIAAGMLQNAGLIEYARGHLRILNRAKLEEAACECYQAVREQLDSYLKLPSHNPE